MDGERLNNSKHRDRNACCLYVRLWIKYWQNRIGELVDKVVGRMLREFLVDYEGEVSHENHVVQRYRELISGLQDKDSCVLNVRFLVL